MDNMLDTVMQQVNYTNVSDQTGNNANGVQSNGSNVDNISEESRANNDNTETPIGAKKPIHNKSKQPKRHLSDSASGPKSKRPTVHQTSLLKEATNSGAPIAAKDLPNVVAALVKTVNQHEISIENLNRNANAYSIRLDGIPTTADNPRKVMMDIIRSCLQLSDIKEDDFSNIKFIQAPKNSQSKSLYATFIRSEAKQKVIAGCKNLSGNKLYGEHVIRIQNQYTRKQMDERNAALIVKRACEEYGKSFPEFLNGTGHLKLVGYNMLDIAGQTKAKFFNLWLQSLNNACKSNPCNSEKFKQDLEKANAMTSQLGHKIH